MDGTADMASGLVIYLRNVQNWFIVHGDAELYDRVRRDIQGCLDHGYDRLLEFDGVKGRVAIPVSAIAAIEFQDLDGSCDGDGDAVD